MYQQTKKLKWTTSQVMKQKKKNNLGLIRMDAAKRGWYPLRHAVNDRWWWSHSWAKKQNKKTTQRWRSLHTLLTWQLSRTVNQTDAWWSTGKHKCETEWWHVYHIQQITPVTTPDIRILQLNQKNARKHKHLLSWEKEKPVCMQSFTHPHLCAVVLKKTNNNNNWKYTKV